MSRGRFIIWLVLLAVVALITLAWFSFREPRAHGKPLSYWLQLGIEDNNLFNPFGRSPEAEAAIREIGTKAIPTLLAKLRATDPPWKERTYEWLNKQDIYKFEPAWEQDERAQGLYGFVVLGNNALPALPELEKMFWDTNTSWAAAGALGELGLPALPILRAGLTHTNLTIRGAALYGTNPTNMAIATVNDVRPLIHDPDMYVSLAAFWRLIQFSSREEATALAMDTLQSNRTRLRVATLNRLSRTNIDMNKIVPLLVRLLDDPDPIPHFRVGVTNALKRLDPVAAATAGINTNPPSVSNRRSPGRSQATAGTNNPAVQQ